MAKYKSKSCQAKTQLNENVMNKLTYHISANDILNS